MTNQPTINIFWGTGENAALSNLTPRPFRYCDRRYESVEHAYQTLKSGEFDSAAYTAPGWHLGGKRFTGKRTLTRCNWNIDLMEQLMLLSFEQNQPARAILLATRDAEITHLQDRGIWRTEFPRILTNIRGELR